MIRESGLPPHKTVTKKFEIDFTFEDVKEGGKSIRKILAHDMTIDIELWYLPFGVKDEGNSFLWQKESRSVSISKTGK